jgi:putative ABC transport system substrate-binding protein
MEMELIPVQVYYAGQVPDALSGLRGRVDALWSVADSTVFNSKSIRYVITYTLRNKIPFMGISSYFVKEGALISLSPDYYDVGRQTGEIAVKVLDGRAPSSIPAERPRKFVTSINLRTAWKIGIKVPQEFLANAEEVIR